MKTTDHAIDHAITRTWKARVLRACGAAGLGALCTALLVTSGGGQAQAQSVPAEGTGFNPAPTAHIRVVQEGPEGTPSGDGVLVELVAPPPSFEPVFPRNGQQVQALGSSGWQVKGDGLTAGQDGLPAASLLLGAPPGAAIVLEVETQPGLDLPLPGRLVHVEELSQPETGQMLRIVRALDGGESGDWARVSDEAVWRGQRIVRLELRPYRIDAAGNRLAYAQQIRVKVTFDFGSRVSDPGAVDGQSALHNPQSDILFEPLLAATLANYATARAWRLPQAATADTPQPELPVGEELYKIEVEADGLYTVSYEALLAAGLDVTHTPPLSLALSWRGQPVAVEDVGDGDELLEPGEGLRFFGLKFHGSLQDEKYTDANAYWLSVTETVGTRMASRPADLPGDLPALDWFTDTLRAEEALSWWPRWTDAPQSSDTWFWDYINTDRPVTRTYTTSVPFPAPGAYSITVRANAAGRDGTYWGSRTHHVRVALNGALVADTIWDGETEGPERQVSQSLDAAHLLSGTNSLAMTVLTDTVPVADVLFFNWFELTYRRAFSAAGGELSFSLLSSGTVTVTGLSLPDARAYDTSVPTQPLRIALPASGPLSFEAAAGSYWLSPPAAERAPARLSRYTASQLDPPGGADYVIVSHASLVTQAGRLAAFHTGRGLTVTVVDVAELYNQYNGGVYHPEAIRRYLWHAYDTWARRPSYVLLMGEGNFNFKDYSCVGCGVSDIQGEPILIPPYLAFADPWQGEVPADNLFVAVSGDDPLPDMMIGRLPALNAAEAEVMVDKLLAQPRPQYEPGSWRGHFLCVADNPDEGGNFWSDCDAGLALVPGKYTKSKVYHQQAPYTSTAATSAAIIQSIDVGAANLIYHGHGSTNRWAHEPLLNTTGVSSLANTGRLPVIQAYGCLDGMFFYPNNPSMAEVLLRLDGRGSIGQWSSAGLGYASQHAYLQSGFLKGLFEDGAPFPHGASTFGQAALAGKLTLWASLGASANHLYQTYTLFGDPALPLTPYLELAQQATPEGWQPGQLVTYTLVFTNVHFQPSVDGVLTNVLPAGTISQHVTWSGAVFTPAGEGVWQVGSLVYNAPAWVTISARLESYWTRPQAVLTNTAYLLALPSGEMPVTTSASLARQVSLPDVQMAQALEPIEAWRPGDAVTFSLSFSNAGASPAWSAVVTDLTNVDVTLQVAYASRPITPLNAHAWQVGNLLPGDGGTLVLTTLLPEPGSAYVMTNTAIVGSPIFDPFTANNTSIAVRPVRPIHFVYMPVILKDA